jgi:hypothetical protein
MCVGKEALVSAWLKLLGSALHWVVFSSLLVCAYALIVVPAGLVLRLMGRDPMQRDFSRTATSYWE